MQGRAAPGMFSRLVACQLSATVLLAATLLAVCVSPALADGPDAYAWTNFVGQPGGPGNVDGTGSAARFFQPAGVAVDGEGNVYVADTINHMIRKVTPAGVVTTLAGPLLPGNTGGTGAPPMFFGPVGLALDSAGNVYVADEGDVIRKVTPAGVVTTLAGCGLPGSSDGTGDVARFYHPSGVAVDGENNVYVADTYNHTIRKVTPAGVVTTLAGCAGLPGSSDGTGDVARFYHPSGVAVNSEGKVYVADTYNHTIRRMALVDVTVEGHEIWNVTTLAGQPGPLENNDGTDGMGSAARFGSPCGITIDSAGNLYVADDWHSKIRKVTPEGFASTLAGGWPTGSTDGIGGAARFELPSGVAVDGTGNVYVADMWNCTIRKVTPDGVVSTLAGLAPSNGRTDGVGSTARFFWPYGATTDSAGNVYVGDSNNNTIRKVTPAGAVKTLAGGDTFGSDDGTSTRARFDWPRSAAVDSAGNVYVADGNNTIRKVTPLGVVTTLAGSAGHSGNADGTGDAARFRGPYGIAVDTAGNVYVADEGNSTIRRLTLAEVTPDGKEVWNVTTLAGATEGGPYQCIDGVGSAARFGQPTGIAVDAEGNLYVADRWFCMIRKVTPAGVVTTLAGGDGYGSTDGTGSAARFSGPEGVAVDSAGNVYVADTGNSTIRKITPAGVVTTIGGTPGVMGSADGVGSAAIFSRPAGIAVDDTGNLYVVDTYNHRISRGASLLSPPAIMSASPLPSATAHYSYTQALTAAGGKAPYSWSIASGSLPAGLSLSSDGVISGAPSTMQSGDGSFTIRVTDSNGVSCTKDFHLLVSASIPSNDAFADAIQISGATGQTAGTNIGATKQSAEPNHARIAGGKSVWWRWTPPSDGVVTISTAGSNFDTLLAVYTASSLEEMSGYSGWSGMGSDDFGGAQSQVTFSVYPYTTYWIAVDGYAGATGDIVLSWNLKERLAITREIQLPRGKVGVFYNEHLTASGGTPPYEWSLLGGGLPSGLSFGPDGVISGTPSAATDYMSFNVQVTDDDGNSAWATFLIRVTPPNDMFDEAIAISGVAGQSSANNNGATAEPYEPNHAGCLPGGSGWWSWRPPVSGQATIDTFGSSFNTILAVYTGHSVAGLTPVTSFNGPGSFQQSQVTFLADPATTYHIAVDGGGGDGTIILNWSLAPTITTPSPLPEARVDITYSQMLGATGGMPPYAWSLGSGNLPSGLALSSDGLISGTPSEPTTADFTIQVTDNNGLSVTKDFSLTVRAPLANDMFAGAIAISGSAGQITGTNAGATKEADEPNHAGNWGGASVWWNWTAPSDGWVRFDTFGSTFNTLLAVYRGDSVGDLTSVASNDDAQGAGLQSRVTFTAVAGTTYRIAVDGFGGSTGTIALNWGPAALTITTDSVLPSGSVGMAYNQMLAATDGQMPYTWSIFAGMLPDGLTLSSDGQISGTPSGPTTADFTIQVTDNNGLSVTKDFSLMVRAPLANDMFAGAITISGSSGHTTGTNAGATKETGEPDHAGNSGGASVWWRWTAPATGQVVINTFGSTFDTLLAVYRGDSVNGLTAVASNDDAQGAGLQSQVTFTVVAGTTYRIAVDGFGGSTGTIALNWGPAALTITTDSVLPSGSVGMAYNQMLAATGGKMPYIWSVSSGSLPAGLTLSANGLISGIPTEATTASFTVEVAGDDGAVSAKTFSLTITGPSPTIITTSPLPDGTLGVPYSQTLAAMGGTSPYTWQVFSGILPAGLSLSYNGQISGTPSQVTTASFTVMVTDGTGVSSVAEFTLTISTVPWPTITAPNPLPSGALGVPYAMELTAIGGAMPYTWSITAGTLPAGLALTSDGRISGTPGELTIATFTVQVAGSDGLSSTKDLSLTIAEAYTWTNYVGQSGVSGYADGPAGEARFSLPTCVAVDSQGNVYVTEMLNSTIRKVTPEGVVTTLAGMAGASGSADGTGSDARFYFPTGVAVDRQGNLYVADTFNCTIRKVTPEGVVTTLAGCAGVPGSADGTGSAARFYFPIGVAVDGTGNIYIADAYNCTIRKMTPAGDVSTLAGCAGIPGSTDGAADSARFNMPEALAADSEGNVYVADSGNHTIRKVTQAGTVTTLAGTAGVSGATDGAGSIARFKQPFGIAVGPTGNLYVVDSGNNTIRQITPAGLVTTIGGAAGIADAADGIGSQARFNQPTGIAVDAAGRLYVTDAGNSRISTGTAGGITRPVPSNPSPADTQSNVPVGSALSWNDTAPDTTFDIYLDTVNPPIAKVATGLSVTTFSPTLTSGTHYYWQVVAISPAGQTAGPVWSFTTHVIGDANGDNCVNVGDLQILVVAWGSQKIPPGGNWNADADLNTDDFVNVGDLQLLVAHWGE